MSEEIPSTSVKPRRKNKKAKVILLGERFGLLTVNEKDGRHFFCTCDCGGKSRVHRSSLIDGRTRSCGCLAKQNAFKHGNARYRKATDTYICWKNMLARCNNPKNNYYNSYGGRGIKVCERWSTFKNFLSDMGEKPEGFSIERKNNDMGYTPENCVWATAIEQAGNKRNNKWITYGGKTQILRDWARETGIHYATISARLCKLGWGIGEALGKEVRHPPKNSSKKAKEGKTKAASGRDGLGG